MARFISVLDSQLNDAIWTAVQWAETKAELQANPFYTAGVNLSLPKNSGDRPDGNKTIQEVATGTTANATMIKLAPHSINLIRLAKNKAVSAFIKRIKKINS